MVKTRVSMKQVDERAYDGGTRKVSCIQVFKALTLCQVWGASNSM